MTSNLDGSLQEELGQVLVKFISQVEYSELVTVENNLPHIRPMVYVNRGLTIYMASRRQAQKIKQIKTNPHVSVVILKSFKEGQNTKEVIIEGVASVIADEQERRWVFDAFKTKPPAFQEWAERNAETDYEVIKIEPRLVKYFDYSTGESEPQILHVS